MFNLMEAIRQKQKTQPLPPADSAETAETAQPRALASAENLRKPADFSAGDSFSATFRKNPQAPKIGKPTSIQGFRDLSANPHNPQTPENKQNPDAMLIDLAQTLQADAHRLRALLSDDDMRDIAQGQHSRGYLLAYFRLMRSDGKALADDDEPPTHMASEPPDYGPSHVERLKAWKPTHDSFINHVMACPNCYAPQDRYCITGADLRGVHMRILRNYAIQRALLRRQPRCRTPKITVNQG